MPFLAFWPFVSAMPAFALANATSASVIAFNAIFLLTGFWPCLALLIAYKLVTARMEKGGYPRGKEVTGLAVGVYAMAWTSAYAVFAILRIASCKCDHGAGP